MTTYTVTITREDGWWMVHIPDLDGLTQTRRLIDAEAAARSWIVVTDDVAPSTVDIKIVAITVIGTDILPRQQNLAQLREDLATTERMLREHSVGLARDLADADVPLRDIGRVLGVSAQRAHQLLTDKT